MLLLLLACADDAPAPTDDTAIVHDTGEADADTAEPPPAELLDACAVTGGLVRDWSTALPGVRGTPGRIAWDDGTLAVLVYDGGDADTLHVFDLASPPTASGLAARWSITAASGLAGLALPPTYVAVGDGETLRIHDRVTGDAFALPTADAPITSLVTDGTGVFGGTDGQPFRWDGALTHDAALGVSGADAVGRTPEGYWTASDARVGFSDGSRLAETDVNAFGPAVDVVPRHGGGAWVLGGPDSYAWFAGFDGTGALVASTQTFLRIPQAAGSPASAYAWTSFLGLGLLTVRDDQFNSLSTTGAEDVAAIAVDPDGRWLLTAHRDGTLARWSCVP